MQKADMGDDLWRTAGIFVPHRCRLLRKICIFFDEKYECNCGDCTTKQKILTDHATGQLYFLTSSIDVKKHHTHQGVMLFFFDFNLIDNLSSLSYREYLLVPVRTRVS